MRMEYPVFGLEFIETEELSGVYEMREVEGELVRFEFFLVEGLLSFVECALLFEEFFFISFEFFLLSECFCAGERVEIHGRCWVGFLLGFEYFEFRFMGDEFRFVFLDFRKQVVPFFRHIVDLFLPTADHAIVEAIAIVNAGDHHAEEL